MAKLFIIELIDSLIENQIIKEGITIPYLLGASKIHDKDTSPVTFDYIQQIFTRIITESDRKFFIKSCTNVDNHFTISLIDEIDDYDIITNKQYKHLDNENGIPIIYFEEYFDCPCITLDNVCDFFWTKYKETCFIPQKYTYTNIGWAKINHKNKEYQIIKNI